MTRISCILLTAFVAAMVGGCNVPQRPSVFVFYDACGQKTASFVSMAECGKRTRNDECTKVSACSALGNAAVQYADALSESVQRGEVSDAEARQRWIKFKVDQINHAQSLALQSAAIVAASAPTTCFSNGFSTTCY